MDAQVKMTTRQHEAYSKLIDETTTEVLYGGGARGGKSYLGNLWIVLQALSKPGSAWLIGRNELKKLKQTTLLTFFEVINNMGLRNDIKYNEQMGMIYFKKQDVHIFLADLGWQPSDPEYSRFGSFGLTGYFIDEAQEVNIAAINALRGRLSVLSGSDDEGNKWSSISKALYTCNPDKGWIYHEFYKPWKNGKLEGHKAFIPSLVQDNTMIPIEDRRRYIEQLRRSDKVTVERLLYGNFDYDESPNRMFEYDKMGSLFTNNEPKPGKRYITCDVARMGGDMCVIYVWNGYIVEEIVKFKNQKTTVTEDILRELATKHAVTMQRIIVDEDGVGGGIVDHLGCRGFMANLSPISPLSRKYLPEKKRNYVNLKTQCYDILAKRINDGLIYIKDDSIREKLIEELDVMCYVDVDKDDKIKITSKDRIKEQIGRSPDYADALMMRMFFDLSMTDSDFERYGIYAPHVDEDIYGNKITHGMSLNFIQEEWDKLARPKNTYLARTGTNLF